MMLTFIILDVDCITKYSFSHTFIHTCNKQHITKVFMNCEITGRLVMNSAVVANFLSQENAREIGMLDVITAAAEARVKS